MEKMRWSSLVLAIAMLLLLAACANSGNSEEPTTAVEATEPDVVLTEAVATPTAEMSDVPIFEGAVDYKTTGDGTYITYNVPDTTVEIVTKFYQEQLVAQGWEQENKRDSSFGSTITILRSKPDKNISVTIDSNAVNNGVRVLITLIPK